MGNCYPSVNAPSVTPTIEMSVDTIQLPCMICDRQFCPEEFKNHLDKVHYMSIKDNIQGISCYCLLCGEQNSSTERHNKHLENVHFRFQDKNNNRVCEALDLNSELRKKVKQIPISFIFNVQKVETDEGEYHVCEYLGNIYNLVETKQQDDLGLDQKYVLSNLVWKQIFTKYPQTEYFAVGNQEGAKRGYLLMSQ